MKIISIGAGERERFCAERLEDRLCGRQGALILLPIPSSRDGIFVSGSDRGLDDVKEQAGEGATVVGYGLPDVWRRELCGVGCRVVDLSEDEELVSENALLTAEAVLGKVLCEAGISVRELSVGIVGWGRIGSRLGALLLFMGARVKVITTSPPKQLELSAMGIDCVMAKEAELAGLDLLINTSPQSVIDSDALCACEAKIYDLASGNALYGCTRVEKLPSLPTVYYAKSAADAYARAVLRALDAVEGTE